MAQGICFNRGKEFSGLDFHAMRLEQRFARTMETLIRQPDGSIWEAREDRAEAIYRMLGELCPSVRQSMSRKRNWWGNACAESSFKTLKRELETVDGNHTVGEVRQSVFMYVEAYYNRIRMHSVLDYVAPDVFNSGRVA